MNYNKWLYENLIPTFHLNSVIAVDNVPYHKVKTEKSLHSNIKTGGDYFTSSTHNPLYSAPITDINLL